MGFLKKSLVVFLILLNGVLFAQDISAITKAFEESYTLEQKGEYKQAIIKMKSVYIPRGYEINLRLGWLHYYAGYYSVSTTYYQVAVDLMPYSIEAKFGLAKPLTALKKWDSAIKIYKDILELDPMNSIANYQLGTIYYNKKDYNNAYKYYEIVANAYPFDYDATLMFAWTNYYLGKSREAKILFKKVLLISPNNQSALKGLKLI